VRRHALEFGWRAIVERQRDLLRSAADGVAMGHQNIATALP